MSVCLQADPGKLEAELPNGLIMGHAYSITGVKMVILQQFLLLLDIAYNPLCV